jgi:hypothetical protein
MEEGSRQAASGGEPGNNAESASSESKPRVKLLTLE